MCIFLICRSVYIVYTILGDVCIYVVGKDEYDELACKCEVLSTLSHENLSLFLFYQYRVETKIISSS